MSDAYLKLLSSQTDEDQAQQIDYIVLCLLSAVSPTYKKKVLSIWKKHIKSGLVSTDILASTIQDHKENGREFFESFLYFADILLSEKSGGVNVSSCIYSTLFESFDIHSRQVHDLHVFVLTVRKLLQV
jgi:hypothetical protein